MGDKLELLTTEQVAYELSVTVKTLRKWRQHGKGPKAIKMGNRLRYRISDVSKWLDEQAEAQRTIKK